MRTWLARLSLLALIIGFTPPVSAGTLNDIFTFPHVRYTPGPNGGISGEGHGGQYLGMGDLTVTFDYSPDPEGGHPNGRHLRFFGVIPELGITEETLPCSECPIWAGIMLTDEPVEFPGPPGPGFLRFLFTEDESHPALSVVGGEGHTWDVRLPLQRVPAPAAALLLGTGVLLLVVRMRRRSTRVPDES